MNTTDKAAATDTVRIEADRFEQSPFHDFYANENTVLGVAAGRFFADDNGEDTETIYRALRSQAVLFDVPEKPWQIEGPDALAFLERLGRG